MPEKHEYQGETYYYNNGHWTDRNHIIVPMAINGQLDRTFGKRRTHSVRRSNRGCRVWVRVLPGCYGCRG